MTDLEFCINCGVNKSRVTMQSNCNHIFKKPLEFFIPSVDLYGKEKIDWILYTVDNSELSVYIDSADYTGPRQKAGSGGIVLRNLRLVYQKHLLNDPIIFSDIKKTLKTGDKEAKEILRLLSYIEELFRNVEVYSLNEFNFNEKTSYPTLKIENSPLMKFIDISGTVKLSSVIKDIQVHGQWGAKKQEL